MTSLIVLLCIILITIVLVQIGKVYELTNVIKGERQVLRDNSKWNGWFSLVFLVVFLGGVFISAYKFKNVMFGYGPHASASEHGKLLDDIFFVTLVLTGIVFVLCHIALFWFTYKYRYQEGRKAKFIPHDNRLEIWWTAIPAVVMTILVVRGLNAWNTVMADVKEGEDYMEIEATAQQFGWTLRYPGADGKIGTRDYKKTTGANTLGMDFTDPKTWDDFIPGQEFMLPVGKKVRVRIIAKDVLHNFYLPQFRVKMDAVPGLPTYFVFTPAKTTADYRNELRKYPEYNEPFDPADPNGPKRWEKFDYELACAELCGKGHYSMRRVLKVVSQEEYDAWVKQQKSFYLSEMRPFKERLAADAAWLLEADLETFHAYSFATFRQFGACYELAATYLQWLGAQGVAGLGEAEAAFREISTTTKAYQFQLARAMARKKPFDITVIDTLAGHWDRALGDLRGRFGA